MENTKQTPDVLAAAIKLIPTEELRRLKRQTLRAYNEAEKIIIALSVELERRGE